MSENFTITTRSQWVMKCTECTFETDWASEKLAKEAGIEHNLREHLSPAVGPHLKGKVFDSQNHAERLGTIWQAQQYAVANGWGYLAWNGWVFPSANIFEESRLCLTRHVPGLFA